MASDETNYVPAPSEGPQAKPLTGRERRQRILLLILLLLLLAIAAAATYFVVVDRRSPVPQFAQGEEMLPPPQYIFSITGKGASSLDRPVGVDISDQNRVYTVDFGNRRISVFTRNGDYLFSFNKIGGGTLRNPVHLQIVNDEVWVTDRRLRGLYVFGLDGKFKREFVPRNEPGLEWTPLALAFDDEGRLRATDVNSTDKHRLMYFSEDGSRTATIGKTQQVNSADEAPGTFYFPNGLAIADDGRVFVSDGNNRRIQVFDKSGKFERFIDTSGVPRGIAIDEKERLYVVDALAHTVDVYSLDGELLTQFGTRGFGAGQFNYPNDIAMGPDARIYVTDRENDQVQVWAWSGLVVPAGVVPSGADWRWFLLLLPLLLLPLLLLARKRRYVLTPAFFEALENADRLEVLTGRRLRIVAPTPDAVHYEGKFIAGEEAGKVIDFEDFSESDVAAMRDKLRCTEAEAIYLSTADRARALLSENIDLRRLGIIAQVRVLDVSEFLEEVDDRVNSWKDPR